MTLCLALNYGSRQEIVAACRRLALEYRDGTRTLEQINETSFDEALDTGAMPPLDLVVRTAGEYRLSNFLLWQFSYAELFVTEVCWPDFRQEQLDDALRSFAARERRFGGLPASGDA